MAKRKKKSEPQTQSMFTEKQQAGVNDFSKLLKTNKTVLAEFRNAIVAEVVKEYYATKKGKPYLNKLHIQQMATTAANNSILALETLGVEPVEGGMFKGGEQVGDSQVNDDVE